MAVALLGPYLLLYASVNPTRPVWLEALSVYHEEAAPDLLDAFHAGSA